MGHSIDIIYIMCVVAPEFVHFCTPGMKGLNERTKEKNDSCMPHIDITLSINRHNNNWFNKVDSN
jgi:hypothetical protein